MAKENSRERIIQLAFGAYPEAKEFHFTSDNQAFSEESDAKNHATTLKDKEVELIKRSDVKKSSKEEDEKKDELDPEDERAALVEEYEVLLKKKPAHNTGIPKLQAAIDKARALEVNADVEEQGAVAGDEIEVPKE